MRTTVFVLTGLFVLMLYSEVWAQATTAPRSSSWQTTARITGLIEPHDPFLRYTTSRENDDLLRIRQNNERFWQALRDSLNDAMRNGSVQAYTVRPSQRAGMQRIFVKDQPIMYQELIEMLDRNLERVASTRIGEVIYITSRGDVFNLQNFVADNNSYFSNLNAISLYEFEFEVLINENGMKINPIQLIFGSALYPGRITFDNNPNDFFNDLESGIAFMIDFADENTKEFFFSRGIGRSASEGISSFYDLVMSFRYPHFFFSIDGIELVRATESPFEYELNFIREEVRTQLFSIMKEFIYGEIPSMLRQNNP